MAGGGPLLRMAGIAKGFPGVQALRGVDFTVGRGEVHALLGENGAGKSTLLKILAGAQQPDAGTILFDGAEVRLADPHAAQRLGIVTIYQEFNLIPTLTVLENTMLPAELGGSEAREAESRARQRLKDVGLLDRAREFPDRLSGGEQQRVAIARALVRDPRLVLADEPTGNLDDATGRTVLDLLDAATRGAGKALVLVTHSDAVARRADRVLAIEDGRLLPIAA